jgi:hypothetical protein
MNDSNWKFEDDNKTRVLALVFIIVLSILAISILYIYQ